MYVQIIQASGNGAPSRVPLRGLSPCALYQLRSTRQSARLLSCPIVHELFSRPFHSFCIIPIETAMCQLEVTKGEYCGCQLTHIRWGDPRVGGRSSLRVQKWSIAAEQSHPPAIPYTPRELFKTFSREDPWVLLVPFSTILQRLHLVLNGEGICSFRPASHDMA